MAIAEFMTVERTIMGLPLTMFLNLLFMKEMACTNPTKEATFVGDTIAY